MTEAASGRSADLTQEEARRLYRWQRRVIQVFSCAVCAVAAALALRFAFSDAGALVIVLLALGFGLLVSAVLLQFTRRCPRCSATLGVQALPLLPDRCRTCGVGIPRPPGLDSEIDN